jgi:hypothetical protein
MGLRKERQGNPMSQSDDFRRLIDRLDELSGKAEDVVSEPPRSIPPPLKPHFGRDDAYAEAERIRAVAGILQAERRGGSISPWIFVLATALNTTVVAVLAVVITLGVVQQDTGRDGLHARALPAAPRDEPDRDMRPAATSPVTVGSNPSANSPSPLVRIEPIGSPQQPLRLEAMQPARLPLQIEPEMARSESFLLILTGLPQDATLSGASKIGSDTWLLAGDAASRLELTISQWSPSPMEIDVELRRTNGAMAARTKAWVHVPPPAVPERQKLDDATIKELMQRAEELLSQGDVVASRQLYERAAEMGSADAAMSLAATYDPRRLWSLGVLGMVGSKERARQWYQRADELGHTGAKERLRALEE